MSQYSSFGVYRKRTLTYLDINGWFNDTYCKLNLKDPNGILIETQKQVVAPFVEDRPYQ